MLGLAFYILTVGLYLTGLLFVAGAIVLELGKGAPRKRISESPFVEGAGPYRTAPRFIKWE